MNDVPPNTPSLPQPSSSLPPATGAKRAGQHAEHETIKETIESIVIAFIMAFVFRAFIVEAFIIPTGSMAPTLLGEHLHVVCPQCGYRYDVDPAYGVNPQDTAVRGGQLQRQNIVVCPMCHAPPILPPRTRIGAGDRILVLKPIYTLSQPRRWDVVVFKAPHTPQENYIKRLVGLPNEQLLIVEGNIYTKPLGEDDSAWHIQRKSDRPSVQNAVWQPIYHSRFVPLDQGNPRINPQRTVAINESTRQKIELAWSTPWQATLNPKAWQLDRADYRCTSDQPSAIAFDYARQFRHSPRYVYNQFRKRLPWESDRFFDAQPIEDIRLSTVIQPDQSGLSVELSTSGRWADLNEYRPVTLSARWHADGRLQLLAIAREDQTSTVLAETRREPMKAKQSHRIELWLVDQQLSLWIDGKKTLTSNHELSIDALRQRPPLANDYAPQTQIHVAGSPVTLHDVQLDRDLYYASQGSPTMPAARGTWVKTADGSVYGQPVMLTQDQFFCCGDNSPSSYDSRLLTEVDPWYWHQYWNDRPSEEILGRVPRDMMMGRAFLVYWPAMHGTSPQGFPFIPNFSDMRFIH